MSLYGYRPPEAPLPREAWGVQQKRPAPVFKTGPVEQAFKWPEPSNPNAYNPLDNRHTWKGTIGGHDLVPKHRPAPCAPSPACTPPAMSSTAPCRKGARTLVWPTGDTYEGDISASGEMEGFGRLTFAASGDAYEGDFKRSKRTGRGAYHHATGVVTVGEFKDDRLVGVTLRWSADRRQAWALLDGEVERENARVAPPDAKTAHDGLRWNRETHGAIALEEAWRLACACGLERIALRVGAPRMAISVEPEYERTTPTIWAKLPRRSCAPPVPYAPATPQHRPSPAMRQAAYMEPGLRSTYRPGPPEGSWPWPVARPIQPTRRYVDRTLFTGHGAASAAAAAAAAAGTLPYGSADRAGLQASIYAQMRKEAPAPAPEPSRPRTAPGAPEWTTTPGATPLAPTPAL